MTEKSKIRIVVDEYTDVVAQIDAMAEAESLSRSDIIRRAIRRLLFSSTVPTSENIPQTTDQVAA